MNNSQNKNERLQKALRENLKRRKKSVRTLNETDGEKSVTGRKAPLAFGQDNADPKEMK